MKAAAGFMILAALIAFLACVAVKEQAPQPRMPVVDVSADDPCELIDHRSPGYLHPWEPVTDPDKDPRSYA